jgi:hypothetical protein
MAALRGDISFRYLKQLFLVRIWISAISGMQSLVLTWKLRIQRSHVLWQRASGQCTSLGEIFKYHCEALIRSDSLCRLLNLDSISHFIIVKC